MQISNQLIEEVHGEIREFLDQCPDISEDRRKNLLNVSWIFQVLNELYLNSAFPLYLDELLSGAIRYINSEYDFLPVDFSGPLGSLDDIMVSAFVLKQISDNIDISEYCKNCRNPNPQCLDIIEFCSQYLPDYVREKIYRDFTLN